MKETYKIKSVACREPRTRSGGHFPSILNTKIIRCEAAHSLNPQSAILFVFYFIVMIFAGNIMSVYADSSKPTASTSPTSTDAPNIIPKVVIAPDQNTQTSIYQWFDDKANYKSLKKQSVKELFTIPVKKDEH